MFFNSLGPCLKQGLGTRDPDPKNQDLENKFFENECFIQLFYYIEATLIFLEVGEARCTQFNIAIYEAKHKEKGKMKNISHIEKAFHQKLTHKQKIRRKNGFSKSKVAEINKPIGG